MPHDETDHVEYDPPSKPRVTVTIIAPRWAVIGLVCVLVTMMMGLAGVGIAYYVQRNDRIAATDAKFTTLDRALCFVVRKVPPSPLINQFREDLNCSVFIPDPTKSAKATSSPSRTSQGAPRVPVASAVRTPRPQPARTVATASRPGRATAAPSTRRPSSSNKLAPTPSSTRPSPRPTPRPSSTSRIAPPLAPVLSSVCSLAARLGLC